MKTSPKRQPRRQSRRKSNTSFLSPQTDQALEMESNQKPRAEKKTLKGNLGLGSENPTTQLPSTEASKS